MSCATATGTSIQPPRLGNSRFQQRSGSACSVYARASALVMNIGRLASHLAGRPLCAIGSHRRSSLYWDFVQRCRMKKRTIIVNDKMQRGYRYQLTEQAGRNFDPEFGPQLTPKEMLRLGVFGGKYMTDTRKEFPKSWFENAKLARNGPDPSLNYFGVDASQPLSVWRKNGWIHPDDPRGWFQWYCRYYIGRRTPQEDLRQIRRWKAMRRHIRQIELHCEPGDQTCRKRQRQALLHWAYDSRQL
jgi:hypothetical protein